MRYYVMFLLLKFVMLFWVNLIYENIMVYMSLGLAVFLLLWTVNCTRYPRQSHLVLFPWFLSSNAKRSSPRLGIFSSSWFTLSVSERSQPNPRHSQLTSPHSRRKWIRSWNNNKICSPHLPGYLYNVRSIIPSIWTPMHRYPMGQSTAARF